jgi:hypothetical protein
MFGNWLTFWNQIFSEIYQPFVCRRGDGSVLEADAGSSHPRPSRPMIERRFDDSEAAAPRPDAATEFRAGHRAPG